MNNSYRPHSMQVIPPVVKNLLIINVIVFVLQHFVFANKENWMLETFALNYGFQYLKPWQFLSYMFMHADFGHLLFNMFSLWMIGTIVEQHLGSKRFLYFYLVCGIGAAIVQLLTQYGMDPEQLHRGITIGASGAVFGVLFAFGFLYPNMTVMFYFLIPMKAKYLVMGLMAFELFRGLGTTSNVAHFAHLGGALTAFIILKMWKSRRIV